MQSPQHVLVLGAGELGLPVLKHLTKHRKFNTKSTKISVTLQPDTIKSPSASKAITIDNLRAIGIIPLPFDISSSTVSTFASFLDQQSADTVISCTGFSAGAGSQRKIAEAARASSTVTRFVPWQFGVDYDVIGRGSTQPLFDEQLGVRELLRGQSDTEWVIVSVGIFMTFLFETFWGVLEVDWASKESGTARALGAWDNELTTTAPEDIGKCVAEMVFVDWANLKNTCVYLAGDTVTYESIAKKAEEAAGKPFQRELWTKETLRNEWETDKENVLKSYRPIWAEAKGVAWRIDDSYNAKKNMAMTSVENWIQRLAAQSR